MSHLTGSTQYLAMISLVALFSSPPDILSSTFNCSMKNTSLSSQKMLGSIFPCLVQFSLVCFISYSQIRLILCKVPYDTVKSGQILVYYSFVRACKSTPTRVLNRGIGLHYGISDILANIGRYWPYHW